MPTPSNPLSVFVVSTSDRGEKITRPLAEAGVPTTSFTITAVGQVPDLIRAIGSEDPTVVIVDSLSFAGFAVAVSRVLFSIPYVVRIRGDAMTEHRSTFRRHLATGTYTQAVKQIPRYVATMTSLKATRNHLFVSEYLQDLYPSDDERGVVVNTPCFMLDSECDENPQTSLDLPEGQKVILAVANMQYQKKTRGLMQSLGPLSTVLEKNSDTTLLIAGQGPYQYRVEERAEALPGDIRVLGYVSEIESLYNRADIFVHFSLLDGYPSTVLEAYASRTPVVANDAVGMREQIVDGETGYLVDLDKPEELERCIGELLDSPKERERLGEQGYQYVKSNNDSEVIGSQFESYLTTFFDE
ncbi:glycosyltransferase family 4 protein [Halomarina rubra]|uniref:Glycosyltransferase family 4 protein n=1 Tax=Halomarina rubra TaxID=2071873 RepID=A0ABD6AWH7_9EURY|nr:glycosyltransferase family 4 protein [Halomarina rubra]